MNSSHQPTVPLGAAATQPHTTERIRLPLTALQRDAETGAPVPFRPASREIAEGDDGLVLESRLEGHRFLACVERTALGELWQVRTASGRIRLARLLRGAPPEGEARALERLAEISHPALAPFELARGPAGQAVLLCDPHDGTFADWFQECRGRGLPGVPRADLVAAIEAVARDLDDLYRDYRVQHLALCPASLWIVGGRVRLGGFGLAQLLGAPAGLSPAALNPRYAAPELFDGLVSPHCDQYSLALLFAELLTGEHPLRGAGTARLASGRRAARPDLGRLCAGDRDVLARALDRDPAQRFDDCPAFARALGQVLRGEAEAAEEALRALPRLLVSDAVGGTFATLGDFVSGLVGVAVGPALAGAASAVRYRLEPGQSLRHQCRTDLFPGAAPLRLTAFCQEWDAALAPGEGGRYVLTVRTRPSFWQRLAGRAVGLEMEVGLTPPGRGRRGEAAVVIRPFGCGRRQAARLLTELGPLLLDSLRRHLGAAPEQRRQERLPLGRPLRVTPVVGGERASQEIECIGKDVSWGGIGFYLPRPLGAPYVYVGGAGLPAAALAEVVRDRPARAGWYEVGARFAGG